MPELIVPMIIGSSLWDFHFVPSAVLLLCVSSVPVLFKCNAIRLNSARSSGVNLIGFSVV